ncbi:MAG: aldo/keto reductase [Anaerolineales bacterium]|jgi:aryl-alcohol dehydrogenase-like predicted oxidoreductase
MEYRNLGKTGLKVSELCLGTMQFGWTADEDLSIKVLNTAFEAGVNLIDSADIYSRWVPGNPGGVAESIIGKWMKTHKIPRHRVIIATKVRARMGDDPNDEGLSRARIFNAVEDSLRRLDTDYIDLYQSHWFDETTPIEETLTAFDDLIRQGKVRYIGCSNHPSWRLMRALWTSEQLGVARYVSLQPHYNLIHREEFERELQDVCHNYGLGVIPYSPLAGGFLTGKYEQSEPLPESARANRVKNRYFNKQGWSILETADHIAKELNRSIPQIALGWLLSKSIVTSPIIGPRNLEQLEDNLGAVGLRLSAKHMQYLDQASA